MPALDLREQRRRQTGVAAELDEPHPLLQPQRAQLLADPVAAQSVLQSLRKHPDLPVFDSRSKNAPLLSRHSNDFHSLDVFYLHANQCELDSIAEDMKHVEHSEWNHWSRRSRAHDRHV